MVAQTSLAHMIPLAKRYVQTLGETLCPGAPPAPLMYPRSCAWIRQIAPVRQLLGAFTGMADFELLSASFANVAVDQVVAEIEGTLAQLLKFLGFDRSAFAEVVDGDKQYILCSAAAEGVKPPCEGQYLLTSTGLPASFSLDALSSSDHTRTSLERKLPQPNTVVGLVFAPSFSCRRLLVVASSPRLALVRSAQPENGQTNSSRG
jgi:hypothetical protein